MAPLIFDGAGTISGLQAGGLPDSSVTSADIANGAITAAKIGYTGAILQVVQTVKTDTFSTSNTSFTDITGLSVSITPSSASSKILVYAGLTIGNNTNFTRLNLVRGSTSIFVGDAAGSRIQSTAGWLGDSNRTEIVGIQYLDSPATTSSTTYKMQISNNVSETCYVGRSSADSDNTAYFRCPANMIVMEVAG